MNQQQVNQVENSKPSMSPDEIQLAVQRMMAQFNHNSRISFFDHWLNKLGLDPVVAKLEARRKDK